MPTPPSRYRPGAAPDYSHRFHAGNVGDVWKHVVLLEVLHRAAAAGRVSYLDSHAGEGSYRLGATGEWTEGIGRLWQERGFDRGAPLRGADGGSAALTRYLELCRSAGGSGTRPTSYPGSPALAAAADGVTRLLLWERDEATFASLEARFAGRPRAHLERGDGLAALPGALARFEAEPGPVVALVDPTYAQKEDWATVTTGFAAAARASTRAHLVLWYPIKSLTRPNAMRAALAAAGVSGVALEIVTTPLGSKRPRLNGSGVLLVRPPAQVVPALAEAAALIGPPCATQRGEWSFRVEQWASAVAGA